jgi:hypothetical protein
LREKEVEDNDVVIVDFCEFLPRDAVSGNIDGKPLGPEATGDCRCCSVVVFDGRIRIEAPLVTYTADGR